MPAKRNTTASSTASRSKRQKPIDPPSPSSEAKTNLDTFYRAYIACLNARQFSHLDQYVAIDVTHNGKPLGLAGYKTMLERDVEEIPDLQFNLALLLPSHQPDGEEWISARLAFDCSPKGTFLGVPVSGKRVRFCENVIYRLEEGRIKEVHSVIDKVALEAQLRDGGGAIGPTDHVGGKKAAPASKSEKGKQQNAGLLHGPSAEFQQVTKKDFVEGYQVDGVVGGQVYYQHAFVGPEEAQGWYEQLMELDTYQPQLKMYGRTFPQSRHIAAYSTLPNATLSYSGSKITMNHPFPPFLESIRERVEERLGIQFNHVMLNRYDDGSVYIGRHSDNLNNLVIASLSLGAERTFILSPRLPSKAGKKTSRPDLTSRDELEDEALADRKNVKWRLGNGSLLVMQGRTQEFWKHEIPKEASVKHGRISLTFRQLV